MYQIGDKIAHPMHGAGIIESIVTKNVSGIDRLYYVLRMTFSSMTVMIPCDQSDTIGMRFVLDEKIVDQVISAFPSLETQDNQNWNKRYRENMLKLKSGDLYQVSEVVKSLILRDQERRLSTGERKLLANAKQILISEIVLVKGATYSQVEHMLGLESI